MLIEIADTKLEMAKRASRRAAGLLQARLAEQDTVVLVAATGSSQLQFLECLIGDYEIDWSRVKLFHLDEYVGVGIDHPASFAGYIRDRILQPTGIKMFHLLDGLGDPETVIAVSNKAIQNERVDLALVGIGENAHLAFNDPPADFETKTPYQLVTLDRACRQQQVGEGWFAGLEDVPVKAISMSVHQILKARDIICVVPDARKAGAVRDSVEGPISSMVPASILQGHAGTTMFFDRESASLLTFSPTSHQ